MSINEVVDIIQSTGCGVKNCSKRNLLRHYYSFKQVKKILETYIASRENFEEATGLKKIFEEAIRKQNG